MCRSVAQKKIRDRIFAIGRPDPIQSNTGAMVKKKKITLNLEYFIFIIAVEKTVVFMEDASRATFGKCHTKANSRSRVKETSASKTHFVLRKSSCGPEG